MPRNQLHTSVASRKSQSGNFEWSTLSDNVVLFRTNLGQWRATMSPSERIPSGSLQKQQFRSSSGTWPGGRDLVHRVGLHMSNVSPGLDPANWGASEGVSARARIFSYSPRLPDTPDFILFLWEHIRPTCQVVWILVEKWAFALFSVDVLSTL